jgi:acyl dehydratase
VGVPIDPDRLTALPFPDVTRRHDRRACVLYALGVGVGDDPTDPRQLAFATEEGAGVLPTMACTLAHPGFWSRDLPTGIDHARVVHGEEALDLHAPLPSEGDLVGRCRIVEVADKGPGRGALVRVERAIHDRLTGRRLATVVSTSFCRADGGFGGPPGRPVPDWTRPDRPPDHAVTVRTLAQAALIYRLNGDTNPLHADPAFARAAGFPRPVLHGLATFGIAGRALLAALCDWSPDGLRSIGARFSAPVEPGETLRFDVWTDGAAVLFEGWSVDHARPVLARGTALLRG